MINIRPYWAISRVPNYTKKCSALPPIFPDFGLSQHFFGVQVHISGDAKRNFADFFGKSLANSSDIMVECGIVEAQRQALKCRNIIFGRTVIIL